MANKKKAIQPISARAVVNKIKIDSLPSFSFDGDDIIPYGMDNLYPNRIYDAIQKSPTAGGCIKRMNEFVFGQGALNGNFIVNRDNDTFNDILKRSVDSYVRFQGFSLHFNFNPMGQIVEMFNVDFRFVRLLRSLEQAKIANWQQYFSYGSFFGGSNEVTLDLFNPDTVLDQMKLAVNSEDDKEFMGQLFYFGVNDSIYPTSWIDNSNVSASYEHKVQIYQYANIENGFSANTIIKYPSMATGEDDIQDEETGTIYKYGTPEWRDLYKRTNPAGRIESELDRMHGAENSGSSLVVNTPLNTQGDTKDFKMVEHLTPTNVDTLFVNQNEKAEGDILKTFTMPKPLLGVTDNGMFNSASFNDAFNYKNADTKGDRKLIERIFNDKVIPHSVYNLNVQIQPLEMKGQETGSINGADGADGETNIQDKAQATLRGSVGGVNGVLDIQEKFAKGTTSFGSAINILKIIYGFSEEDATKLLGNPEKEESNV